MKPSVILIRSLILVIFAAAGGPALSEPSSSSLVHRATVEPTSGQYIDSPFSLSRDGLRLAYITTDGSRQAELHVRDLVSQRPMFSRSISGLTVRPTEIALLADNRVFVAAPTAQADGVVAWVVDEGAPRQYGPGHDISVARRDGRDLIVVHTVTRPAQKPAAASKRRGKKRARAKLAASRIVTHGFEIFDAGTGEKVRPRTVLEESSSGRFEAIGLEPVYWRDQGLVVVGYRDGRYARKIDQRLSKTEGWYDLFDQRFVRDLKITDPIDHRRKLMVLGARDKGAYFLAPSTNRSNLQALIDNRLRNVTLEGEPLYHYDLQSFSFERTAKDSYLLSLTIDPIHRDAAAAKRAVPVYQDFYLLKENALAAHRVGHFRRRDKRRRLWRARGGRLVILTRHAGWGRGGIRLDIYERVDGGEGR